MHAVWAPSRAAIVASVADWKVGDHQSVDLTAGQPRFEKAKGGFGSSGSPA